MPGRAEEESSFQLEAALCGAYCGTSTLKVDLEARARLTAGAGRAIAARRGFEVRSLYFCTCVLYLLRRVFSNINCAPLTSLSCTSTPLSRSDHIRRRRLLRNRHKYRRALLPIARLGREQWRRPRATARRPTSSTCTPRRRCARRADENRRCGTPLPEQPPSQPSKRRLLCGNGCGGEE